MTDKLFVLVGPTAVGKTALAIELAERVNGEIVSADSMQVYRGMDIGTAKPGASERRRVPFHLVDIAEPDQQITVAAWKVLAQHAIAGIRRRGGIPIVCGGTGLYIRALVEDWTLAETPAEPAVRTALQERLTDIGAAALHAELRSVDPVAAARLHPNDAQRIVRAQEVYHVTGVPITEYQNRDRSTRPRTPALQFGLTLPRPALYARIEQRVDTMIGAGLEEEVRGLLGQGISGECGPMRSLGYKEMIQYINGDLDRTSAIELIKQNTRRYAKRQQTWFGADAAITWFDMSVFNSAEVIAQAVSWQTSGDSGS